MTFSEETLMAYADGEVDEPTRVAIEAALAADPALAQRISRHRALRARLRGAFDPVLTEPVPQRLLAAASATAPRPRIAPVVPLRRSAAPRWSWPQLLALAASLVIGALLGPWLRGPAPLIARDGTLLADGALARALSQQLASHQAATAPVQVGVSFRSHNGDYCRTFVLREQAALAGLACRERDAWRLEALAATEPSPPGEYRAAASALPPAVASTLDTLIAGPPLDARGEAAARDHDWQR